jgi:hypothetical protein
MFWCCVCLLLGWLVCVCWVSWSRIDCNSSEAMVGIVSFGLVFFVGGSSCVCFDSWCNLRASASFRAWSSFFWSFLSSSSFFLASSSKFMSSSVISIV